MKARDLMTKNPLYCTPDSTLVEVCRLMVSADCGAIPVLSNELSREPVGMITDRDVCCRVVAAGLNPLDMLVGDHVTRPCITLPEDASLEECCDVLDDHKIRRVVIVDRAGACVGVVSQADIAREARDQAARLVESVSRRTPQPSNVALH